MDYSTFVSQTLRLYPKFAANPIANLLRVRYAIVPYGTTIVFARTSE
jgi:hypothetical protein